MELALLYKPDDIQRHYCEGAKDFILLQVKLKKKDFIWVFLYYIDMWNENSYAKHLMWYYSAADVRHNVKSVPDNENEQMEKKYNNEKFVQSKVLQVPHSKLSVLSPLHATDFSISHCWVS